MPNPAFVLDRPGPTGAVPRAGALAWLRAAGLAVPLLAAALPADARAQEQRAWHTETFAPCPVIGPNQLGFVTSTGVGRFFPLRVRRDAGTVTIARPLEPVMECPANDVELELEVRYDQSGSSAAAAPVGRIGVALHLAGNATTRTRTGGGVTQAKDLKSAAVCVAATRVESVALHGAPPWLDNQWVRSRLDEHLARHACFDVTSLVYVYLSRGGRL